MKFRSALSSLALGLGFIFAQSGIPDVDLARAQPPPPVCLLVSGLPAGQGGQPPFGPPLFITGTGSSSNQSTAMSKAQNDWSSRATARRQGFGSWSKAAKKNTSCTSSKPTFQWIYSCTVYAQPCQ